MPSIPNERKPLTLLSAMVVAGLGLLTIPWFLTPPAYLDLAVRDSVFDADLTSRHLNVTDDATGRAMSVPIRRIGNLFVARIGRINSGNGSYTARLGGYHPRGARVQAAALQNVRVPVELKPTFGRLEIATFNAIRAAEPVDAIVKDRARALSTSPQRVVTVDLPPGRHRFSAQAPGYCPSEREFEVRAGKITRAALPLSPDLKDDEVARFVLGWRNDPRDLDTHFWTLNAASFPAADTIYFRNKTGVLPDGRIFARLDVDEVYPGRYETLTVRDDADGEFRYFIHVYQGSGTIADAGAMVQVYTRGCQVRTFNPPPDCAYRIWNVTNVRYDAGRVQLTERQTCEPEGTTRVFKFGE
jgi:hypothetical protein